MNLKIESAENKINLNLGDEFQVYLLSNDSKIFRFGLPGDVSQINSLFIKASAFRGAAHDFDFMLEPLD